MLNLQFITNCGTGHGKLIQETVGFNYFCYQVNMPRVCQKIEFGSDSKEAAFDRDDI